MTLKTLESSEILNENYRLKLRVLDKTEIYNFPITLEAKYFGKIFTIYLKELAKNRELAFPYKNTLRIIFKQK
jgi:hypothetical protein